ncbi:MULTISPECIES: tyrosine-type recombinase/integrase [unclassified Bradyrhizobium]|uniref:tyrosine-type recombinase/integrase n=1 Tax=unclassified Bradyrhizobium TaxID=2631580 RepID=UPI002915CADD|nr:MULTISPECIES: tyrosine-type recombinase/integrase [unclassified Bradyrhizobium]
MPAKSSTKHRYLVSQGGRYWARLSVPKDLRSIIGQSELWEALGPDLMQARRKLPGAVARMHVRLGEAREELEAGRKPLSRPPREGRILSVRNLAKAHFEEQLQKQAEERRADLSRFAETIRFQRDVVQPFYAEKLRSVVNGLASNEEADALIGWSIDRYREQGNTDAVFGTPEWRELVQALAGVHLETIRLNQAHDSGDFSAEPSHPLLVKKPASEDPASVRILGPDSERTLSDLAEQFAKEKATSDRTRHDNRVTIRMLEEQIGEPLPIYRLTRQHVHAFKRMLADAPANYTKRFPGMTLPEAVKANKGRAKPYPLLDARTVNDKYLARLHAFLNWAVRADIIPDNAAAGIKVEAVKASTPPRVPFSPGDLTRMFGEHFAPGGKWGEDQWAMVLSLFGGMRASELAQVRLDSVRRERGVLVIAIEEQTKNMGSRRLIPVHSQLLGFGFEQLVAGLRQRKETHLFSNWYRQGMEAKAKAPKETATIDHYFPRYLPRRFNVTYLAKVGIIDDRKSWHSFRHTFKTGLSMAGVGKDMRDQLCGHADNSAGAGYVHGASIEAMAEAVQNLKFDGFPL